MYFLSFGWLIALVFIVHCYKTGRDRWWMFALLMMGPLASAAYLLLEIVPEYFGSYTGQRATKKLQRLLNPKREVKRLSDNMLISDSVETRRRLAEELLERGDNEQAEKLFRESRTGLFADDPVMMLGQAQALYGLERYAEVVTVLDELMIRNPDFRSQHGHLLFARAHGKLGSHDKAVAEFDAVTAYYAGPQANISYAKYLESCDHTEQATALYQKVLDVAKLSPAHYRRTHKQWINTAKQKLKS